MKNFLVLCFFALVSVNLFSQAMPPERINYQGVLRDASGSPLNGSYTMVFRFYNAPTGGTLLWEEIYDNGLHPPQISFSNGLFSVQLGDPTHRTSGSEANFVNVFSKYSDVYLGVQVGTDEEMTPRIKVISSAYSQNANTFDGRDSDYFLDTSSTTQTKTGKVILNVPSGDYGFECYAPTAGYFKSLNSSGNTYLGAGDIGILAYGNDMAGFFSDTNSSGHAFIGSGDIGIEALGAVAGGSFSNISGGAIAYIGYNNLLNYEGIHAEGITAGGYFKDLDNSGYAYIGYENTGILARGNTAAGNFQNSTDGGVAFARLGFLSGNSFQGINAQGSSFGGLFKDYDNSGYALIGYEDLGIAGYGNLAGAYFIDLNSSGLAYIGVEERGIDAYGSTCGGSFMDLDSSSFANIGYSTYKIYGNGGVSFVQNHPYEKDKVIVYSAPEGDEVATYTRGTGRLINGQARIKLDETFKWVTNPDIGLTVYLTPVGEWAELYVEKKSTDEIIVKSKDKNSNAIFDYIVYGLRVGFEESSIVQEKQQESYIPSFKDHRERYIKYPELRSFNALERFKNMEAEVKGISKEEIDLSRAIALKEAIHEYDPEKDPPIEELFGHKRQEEPSMEMKEEIVKEENIPNPPILFEKGIKEESKREIIREEKIIKEEDDLSCFNVYGSVEEGDVLVMNLQNGSSLVLSNKEYDPMVVGVVSKEKECRDGKIYVKTSGVAYVKVDANIKEIKKGDLIVTSQSLGYGMKGENPALGTIIGKALENLDGGTSKIKVLIMAR